MENKKLHWPLQLRTYSHPSSQVTPLSSSCKQQIRGDCFNGIHFQRRILLSRQRDWTSWLRVSSYRIPWVWQLTKRIPFDGQQKEGERLVACLCMRGHGVRNAQLEACSLCSLLIGRWSLSRDVSRCWVVSSPVIGRVDCQHGSVEDRAPLFIASPNCLYSASAWNFLDESLFGFVRRKSGNSADVCYNIASYSTSLGQETLVRFPFFQGSGIQILSESKVYFGLWGFLCQKFRA